MVRHEAAASPAGCLIAFGGIFASVGLIGSVVAYAEGGILPAMFCSIFLLVGLLVIAGGIHQMMGQSLYKDLYLETPAAQTLLGQRVPWKLSLTARKAFRLDKAVVKHRLEEKAILRRGTDSTTFSKNLFEQEKTFDLGREVRAGETVVLEGEFKMPADGPSSFSASNNSLTWSFEAAFDVPGWPDPSSTWPVPMAPVLSAQAFEEDAATLEPAAL